MSNEISVSINITRLSEKVLKIDAIMKGQFYTRTYIGYSKEAALEEFETWLSDKV